MNNLQINITKADTGQLITRFQAFQEDGKCIYNRCDVYSNINALCRGLKKVHEALQIISQANVNVEDEIAHIRKQLKNIEVKADGKKSEKE